MSNLTQQLKNNCSSGNSINTEINNNKNINIKTEKSSNKINNNKNINIENEKNCNDCNNKCKSNNNNLDSSKKKIDEKKNNIITDTFNYSPEITFSQMPILYLNDSFSKMWNGLKLSLNFSPSQFFNIDYMLNVEKNKKLFNNYSVNCSTLIPLNSVLFPVNLMLMGQKKSSRALSLQSYLSLGKKDKITIVTNNIPKDINAIKNNLFLMNKNEKFAYEEEELGINDKNINNIQIDEKDTNNNNKNNKELETTYAIEYSHEFKRGNVGIKLTNLEPNTINFQFSLYKNLFFGMEFFKNPNMKEKYHFLKANYGIMLKQTPYNKFGFTFNYISTLPASIINCCYQINDNFKLYLNTMFNKNELMRRLGQDKFTAAISSYYKNNYIEVNTELNNKGEINFLSSFSCNKYADVLMNFSYDHFVKNNKKKIKCFGFGLNIKNNSVEEKIVDLINKQKKGFLDKNKYYSDYNNLMKLK